METKSCEDIFLTAEPFYHSRHFLKIIAIQPEYESAVIKSCIVSTRGQIIHFAKVSPVLAGMQWLFRLF